MVRPIFHFTTKKNWMNDPNGFSFFDNQFHLFYQYNPYGNKWGTIHWGHATSNDMFRWNEEKVALVPNNSDNETHCFSGCITLKEDDIIAFYTSVGEDNKECRFGASQWSSKWLNDSKVFSNSRQIVLDGELEKEFGIEDWRDPFIFKNNDIYNMILGGRFKNSGVILMYKSNDLINWTSFSILYTDNETSLIECPNYIKFNEKEVLIYSPMKELKYSVGTIKNDVFMEEYTQRFDGSDFHDFYASNILNFDNKIYFIGWIKDEYVINKDYKGAQSIVRELEFIDNTLLMKPIESIKNHYTNSNNYLSKDSIIKIKSIPVHCEIELIFQGNGSILFEYNNYQNSSILIDLNNSKMELSLDRTYKNQKYEKLSHKVDKLNNARNLRIFIDSDIIEVFANNQLAITTRFNGISDKNFITIKKDSDILFKNIFVHSF